MKQLEFWEGFFSPLEVGWWAMFAMDNRIAHDPNASYAVYSKKTGEVICGSVPNEWNGKRCLLPINDDIYGDGNLLHLTRNVK